MKMPINLSFSFNYCTQLFQNSQSPLIMNIIRSTQIQHVICNLNTIVDHFSSGSGARFSLLHPSLSDPAV